MESNDYEALKLALEDSLRYREGKGFVPHPATREALAFLRGEKE